MPATKFLFVTLLVNTAVASVINNRPAQLLSTAQSDESLVKQDGQDGASPHDIEMLEVVDEEDTEGRRRRRRRRPDGEDSSGAGNSNSSGAGGAYLSGSDAYCAMQRSDEWESKPGHDVPYKAIGIKICNFCAQMCQQGQIEGCDNFNVATCAQNKFWNKNKVIHKMTSTRRRVCGLDRGRAPHSCMALHSEYLDPAWHPNQGNVDHEKYPGLSIFFDSEDGEANWQTQPGDTSPYADARMGMCSCIGKYMTYCNDPNREHDGTKMGAAQCMKSKVCGCPSVCYDFKQSIHCINVTAAGVRLQPETSPFLDLMQKRALAEGEDPRQHVAALNQKSSLDESTASKCPS